MRIRAHSRLLVALPNGEVKPSYSDAEILEALNVTNTVVMLLMRMFFVSMGCQREADETEKIILEYGAAKGRGEGQSNKTASGEFKES
jgi:hypothetical protein